MVLCVAKNATWGCSITHLWLLRRHFGPKVAPERDFQPYQANYGTPKMGIVISWYYIVCTSCGGLPWPSLPTLLPWLQLPWLPCYWYAYVVCTMSILQTRTVCLHTVTMGIGHGYSR